jgi:predicted ATPase
MVELETITIKGFKSIAAVEQLPLGALNVLIGPNGAGKSNLIALFRFLQAVRAGRLQEYAGKQGVDNLLYFGPKSTPRLTVALTFRDAEKHTYALHLEPGVAVDLLPVAESAASTDQETGAITTETLARHGREAGISHDVALGPVATWVADQMEQWRLYHFHDTGDTSPMRRAANVDDNRALRPDGANLPAFLYLLQERYPTEYRLIQHLVQRVLPFFDNFDLRPSELNPTLIKLAWRHRASDAYFDAAALSDGALRFIALATVFLQPVALRPPLIVVDEPELGLHPYAISLLGPMAKMAAHTSQIVVATQSSLLLDEFAPEDVLVVERDGHATTFQRLDVTRLESWLADYSLGELWEKNELGGRPTAWRG